MAKRIGRIKKILIEQERGTFSAIFNRLRSEESRLGSSKSDISLVRSLLATEKARILYILKKNQPNSIYELAKVLGRDIKTVRQDVLLLEKIGVIELIPVHKGNRQKIKPLLVADSIEIKMVL